MTNLIPLSADEAHTYLEALKTPQIDTFLTLGKNGEYLGFTKDAVPGAHHVFKEPDLAPCLTVFPRGTGWLKQYQNRLKWEQEAMARHYPDFEFVSFAYEGIGWSGKVKPFSNTYCIQLFYPENFPDESCEICIVSPKLGIHCPPYFRNGHPLGWKRGGAQGANERTPASVYIDWTVRWLICFEIWAVAGIWPE